LDNKAVAEILIKGQKNFRPKVDRPMPSSLRDEIYTFGANSCILDLAAVVAGTKPAAFIINTDDHPLFYILTERAQAAGYCLQKIPSPFHKDVIFIFIGIKENVSELIAATEDLRSKRIAIEEWHWCMGKALGYPTEAIEKFIQKIRKSAKKSRIKARF